MKEHFMKRLPVYMLGLAVSGLVGVVVVDHMRTADCSRRRCEHGAPVQVAEVCICAELPK